MRLKIRDNSGRYVEVTPKQISDACDLTDEQILEKISPVMTNPSDYQMDIFRFFLEQLRLYMEGEPNLMNLLVKATAGSGKTTTIVALAYLIPTYLQAIFVAFNKPIADELGKRLPRHVMAKTLNSVGWNFSKRFCDARVGYQIPFKDFTNNGKLGKLLRSMYDYKEIKDYRSDILWLVGMCQSLGIVPSELAEYTAHGNDLTYVAPNGLDDSDDTFDMLLGTYDRRISYVNRPFVYKVARELLTKSVTTFDNITFDEQKYLPVVLREGGRPLSWRKFDMVIIDEAQDVNAVDMELVDMLRRKNGLVCGVGDNRQSIYVFRGADSQSMDKFQARFNCKVLPLTISYRCARKVVEYAHQIYPEIEAAPNAPEGSVQELESFAASIFNPEGDDLVVCRNNAPIVTFAYKLITNGIPVFVKGRDIGRGLLQIIDKLEPNSVLDLTSKLRTWQSVQIQLALENNPDDEAALQSINDKTETLMVFIRNNADGRVDSLRRDIENLFSVRTKETDDEYLMEGKVILSTIHKAKGLEAERVFFLDPFLMMPRWISEGSIQMEQEKNLLFVAATRPKKDLVFIESKGLK